MTPSINYFANTINLAARQAGLTANTVVMDAKQIKKVAKPTNCFANTLDLAAKSVV